MENHSDMRNNVFMEIEYPSTSQIGAIYLILTVIILASLVPFQQYLHLLVEENNKICPLAI